MKYKLYNDAVGNPVIICRKSDMAFIPMANDNTDYQTYLKWLKEGNTPMEADKETEYSINRRHLWSYYSCSTSSCWNEYLNLTCKYRDTSYDSRHNWSNICND